MATPPTASTARAEQVGEAIGHRYATTTAAIAGLIRRAPTPTWHWRLLYRLGAAARTGAIQSADHADLRFRVAPHRLRTGLRRLFQARPETKPKTKKKEEKDGERKKAETGKRLLARLFITAGLCWWGGEWALRSGVPIWPLPIGGAALLLAAAYGVGTDPDDLPVTRGVRRRQERHAGRLLWAIGQLIADQPGLHLADLADQITTRSRATGQAHTATVATLRAILDPLGVPIRDQLEIHGRNRTGIHSNDWHIWVTRHATTPAPASTPGEATDPPAPAAVPHPHEEGPAPAPMREASLPLPETTTTIAPLDIEKTQVSGGGLEIPDQDLGRDLVDEAPARRVLSDESRVLLRHAHTAIGTGRGAHLRDILAIAQAAGDCTTWSVTRLRRALEAAGIRVEEKLWIRGGNTRGVLATSLPDDPNTTEAA